MSNLEYYWRYCLLFFRQKWKYILFFASLVFFIFVYRAAVDVNSGLFSTPADDDVYKVVFDAGSTGTRVHVFKFNGADSFVSSFRKEGVPNLDLLDILLFEQIEGGLSSFSQNPSMCRIGILSLLNKAKLVIPESVWDSTEVILFATAGLRLLPVQTANAILEEVRDVLTESNFLISKIDTIDGKLEAKLIYVMADFVFKRSSLAIVDLGGGSVQLAYRVVGVQPVVHDEVSDFYLEGTTKNKMLYLHSWLGFGLVAFRMKALEAIAGPHPCVPEWTPSGTQYTYGDKRVDVFARKSTNEGTTSCLTLLKSALKSNEPNGVCKQLTIVSTESQMCGLNGVWLGPNETGSIYEWRLFSYIYDLALAEGLIDKGKVEGKLTANDFIKAAYIHCDGGATSRIEWWKCIDLMYVGVLLIDGFKLDPNYPLMVTKKLKYINNHGNEIHLEAAWPLGAAISSIKQEL